eukprot:335032_1
MLSLLINKAIPLSIALVIVIIGHLLIYFDHYQDEKDKVYDDKPKQISKKDIDILTKHILAKFSDGDEKESKEPGVDVNFMNNDVLLKFIPIKPSYWVVSGWLPTREANHAFFTEFNKTISKEPATWEKTIQEFYSSVIYDGAVKMGVIQMINGAIKKYGDKTPITSIIQMCGTLNSILQMTPLYSSGKNPLIGVPMAALFADVATNPAGMGIFLSGQYNKLLTTILKKWMSHLDSPESFSTTNNGGWLSEEAKLQYHFDNYQTELKVSPYWTSWNKFFTRSYKDGIRQNYGAGDNAKIQLPNDGSEFRYRLNVQIMTQFWLKDMPYSLENVFGIKHAEYGMIFKNGSIFQSYLDPFNYHCYNSPVDGIVRGWYVLEGAYFPQLVWEYDCPDPGAGTLSLPWLSEVNARGIFIIDTKGYQDIGLVCIVAIGMGEVSSVNFFKQKDEKITKGEQFGYFKFGGSSIAVIIEDLSKYGKKLTFEAKFKPDAEENGVKFNVGEIMATISSTDSNDNDEQKTE